MPKISAYGSMSALTGAELILGDQAGATLTMTPAQLAALLGVKKYAANFGDGSNVVYPINHNLGTQDVQVTIYRNATPNDEVIADVQHTSANTITLSGFTTAPAIDQFRVLVWA